MHLSTLVLSMISIGMVAGDSTYTCDTGVIGGDICCSGGCGQCGGVGCSDSGGPGLTKEHCCRNPIRASGVMCSSENGPPCIMDHGPSVPVAPRGGAPPPWTYSKTGASGELPYGPDDWHLGYPDCGLNSQSPINLAADGEEVVSSDQYKIEFIPSLCDSNHMSFHAGHAAWKVYFNRCPDKPHLKFQGEQYNLLQIHIHSPSEHMIGGAEHAADIHMVHIKEGTDSELLVVGVMFDVTEYGTNLEIENLWKTLGVGEETTDELFSTAIYDILPVSPSFSHYMGSLTTPPCSEGVTWIVMNEPNFMSKRQLDEYRRAVALFPGSKVDELGNTNRPAQPLNGRPVYYVMEN